MLGIQSTELQHWRLLTPLERTNFPSHSLCATLRAREWEQCRVHALWHGATVSCPSPLLARCWQGACTPRACCRPHEQANARTESGAQCPMGPPLVGHTSCSHNSASVSWLLTASKGNANRGGPLHTLHFKLCPPNPTHCGSVQILSQFRPTSKMSISPHCVCPSSHHCHLEGWRG